MEDQYFKEHLHELSEELLDWFKSKDYGPGHAITLMGYLASSMIVQYSADPMKTAKAMVAVINSSVKKGMREWREAK